VALSGLVNTARRGAGPGAGRYFRSPYTTDYMKLLELSGPEPSGLVAGGAGAGNALWPLRGGPF